MQTTRRTGQCLPCSCRSRHLPQQRTVQANAYSNAIQGPDPTCKLHEKHPTIPNQTQHPNPTTSTPLKVSNHNPTQLRKPLDLLPLQPPRRPSRRHLRLRNDPLPIPFTLHPMSNQPKRHLTPLPAQLLHPVLQLLPQIAILIPPLAPRLTPSFGHPPRQPVRQC